MSIDVVDEISLSEADVTADFHTAKVASCPQLLDQPRSHAKGAGGPFVVDERNERPRFPTLLAAIRVQGPTSFPISTGLFTY